MAANKSAKAKLDKLNTVKEDIKLKLVDCHTQIDQFADMIAPWYAAKDLLQRPLVINIWGMTGVGKTQMIREFVKGLGISNQFSSVCVDPKNGLSGILNDLSRFIANTDNPTTSYEGIILIDEFQNFVTKGMFNSRTPVDGRLWEILSSGKIHEEIDKSEIITMYANCKSAAQNVAKAGKPSWAVSVYSALRYARLLKLKKPLQEIMTMTYADMLPLIEGLLKNFSDTVFEMDFSKCLFIICGNLDNVFDMASESARVDIDADVVHESCKDITIFDVKRGLSQFLFPEQIARLGNNHIIFYSISKSGYRKIIVQALEQLKEETKKISHVELSFDPSIYKAIYRNGVFPTQGARPVFSTITSMLYTVIPKIIFDMETNPVEGAEDTGSAVVNLSYDETDHTVVTDDGRKFTSIGPVDEAMIRMARDEDERRCTSVHESGHAIVYAELFNAVPAAIVSVIADSYVAAGYINTHQIRHTRVTMKNFITVAVAGMVAEEIVFGKDYRTVGCSSDLVTATNIAAKFIRRYAFSDDVKAVIDGGVDFYNNIGGTSDFINNMVKDCIKEAADILHNNIELLKAESEALFQKSKLEPEEFNAIAEEKGKKYQILKFNARIVPNFNTKYEAFKESNVKDVEELSSESVKALESFFTMIPPKEDRYNDFNPDDFNKNWEFAND